MVLASRGLRDMDGGPEPVEDPEVRRVAQVKAVRLALMSLVVTVVAMLVVFLLP